MRNAQVPTDQAEVPKVAADVVEARRSLREDPAIAGTADAHGTRDSLQEWLAGKSLKLALAMAAGSLFAYLGPSMFVDALPTEPVWARPAVAAGMVAALLVGCILFVNRIRKSRGVQHAR